MSTMNNNNNTLTNNVATVNKEEWATFRQEFLPKTDSIKFDEENHAFFFNIPSDPTLYGSFIRDVLNFFVTVLEQQEKNEQEKDEYRQKALIPLKGAVLLLTEPSKDVASDKQISPATWMGVLQLAQRGMNNNASALPVAANCLSELPVEMMNCRQRRHAPVHDECQSAAVFSVGIVPNTNGQVEVRDDGTMIIRTATSKNTDGCYIDDIIAFLKRLIIKALMAQLSTERRKAAVECISVALVLLDDRAQAKHGFAQRPDEQATPPCKEAILPSVTEWVQILQLIVSDVL